jgi:ACR3 family arsenite transporter
MRSRDLVMIVVSFLAMLAGSFLPGLAEPLAPFPRLCLIVLLYLGFLSVGTEALFIHTRLIPGTVSGLVLIRLFALPLLSFVLFKLLMPQFALGALLVGAASIGVVAPIFSIMVNADTALVLAGNLLSSLLLPLTLPMLLYIVDSFMTLSGFGPMNLPAHLSLSGMTLSLCVTIIVPFVGAFLTRKAPRVTECILKHQFSVSVSTIALSTLAIFSNYSGVLHQSPSLVVKALGAACLLGAVMMVGGLFLPRSMPPQRKLAFLISYGTMNNVLMLIVSLEFFSASESIMAAMYLLPLNALLVYYRALSRSWGLEQAAG